MIRGIGNDIIEIERIRASIARHQAHFLNKVFTKDEQEYCLRHGDPAPRFAGRFAAKEAIVKALGTGFSQGITWLDIHIANNPEGKPYVMLSANMNALFNTPHILLSISHCRTYATAVALVSDGVWPVIR